MAKKIPEKVAEPTAKKSAEAISRPLRLEYFDPHTLQPNGKNWRTHPDNQLRALSDVITEVGWAGACLFNERTGRLIDGHARQKVAIEQGATSIPVLVGDWSEADEAKILATLDPLAAMAETDNEALAKLLAEVDTQSEAINAMLAGLTPEATVEPGAGGDEFDATPEASGPTRTTTGDLWLIGGKHRLLVGDCTDPANVLILMDGKKAILMATDPPYGVDFSGAKYNPRAKEWDGIANDKLQNTDLEDFLARMFAAWLPVMDEQAAFYFWTAAMAEGAAAAAAIRKAGLHIQSQIIWNKNCLVLGQADYHWKHENCWYAFWKGKKHRWLAGRDKTTVWDVKKVANQEYEHPMQKPLDLYGIPIEHHTYAGEIVAEPFLGSGTQLIAAHRLGRICFGCEIEPKYADIILKRAEAEGLTVEKVS